MLFLSASSTGTGSWSTFNMIAQLFFILILFAGTAVLAVYVTRLMGGARYTKKISGGLKIIDSLSLGLQSGLYVVQAGKKCVLLGITKDRITFLCELDESISSDTEDENPKRISFENYLNRVIKKDSQR